jgi:hypothetical protein
MQPAGTLNLPPKLDYQNITIGVNSCFCDLVAKNNISEGAHYWSLLFVRDYRFVF